MISENIKEKKVGAFGVQDNSGYYVFKELWTIQIIY